MNEIDITFTVLGEPQGKARPRVTRYGTYTPEQTRRYELLIRNAFMLSMGQFSGFNPEFNGAFCLSVTAYYGIAQSDAKAVKAKKLKNRMLPTRKPDGDNILKVVADALNGVAYKDDAQATTEIIRKKYSEQPRLEVRLWVENE